MVYVIADVHLLNKRKRGSERLDNIILNRIDDFLTNIVEEGSKVVIAGDLFNIAILRSSYDFLVVKKVLELFGTRAKEKNLKILILMGNHDKIDIVNEDNESHEIEVGLINILTTVENDEYIHFITENEKIDNLVFVPYKTKYDYEEINKLISNGDIVIAHDSDEVEVMDVKTDNHIRVRDILDFGAKAVIKGHIHISYDVDGKIFSPGALIPTKPADSCGYVIIDNDENIYLNKLDPIIKFVNEEADNKEINSILSELDENSIANILFTGSKEYVDEDEFLRCLRTCIQFNMIFIKDQHNLIGVDEVEDSKIDFISLDEYMKNNLDKEVYDEFVKVKNME